MKKLISLISTKGKTAEQISKEVWEAYQKYQKVSAEAKEQTLDLLDKMSMDPSSDFKLVKGEGVAIHFAFRKKNH